MEIWGALFSNTSTQNELPCSASVRILVALLMVVLSPSPAISRISSWPSTLSQDPLQSVEKRVSLKKPLQPQSQGSPRAFLACGMQHKRTAAAVHRR